MSYRHVRRPDRYPAENDVQVHGREEGVIYEYGGEEEETDSEQYDPQKKLHGIVSEGIGPVPSQDVPLLAPEELP